MPGAESFPGACHQAGTRDTGDDGFAAVAIVIFTPSSQFVFHAAPHSGASNCIACESGSCKRQALRGTGATCTRPDPVLPTCIPLYILLSKRRVNVQVVMFRKLRSFPHSTGHCRRYKHCTQPNAEDVTLHRSLPIANQVVICCSELMQLMLIF